MSARSRLRSYVAVVTGRGVSTKKRLGYLAGGMVALGVVFGILLFLYALILFPFTPGISDLRKAKVERPTVLMSADGVQLAEFKPVNRQWVNLDDVAPEVVQALIATEDHRFYSHPGIDFIRTISALLHTLTGDVQGGSTITQQLARNLYPDEIGRKQSITRKLKELITALKIEAVYTKDEILETYLNTVPFLYNAYGIEMAARTYFSESASDLSLTEGATLVGMLKGTYFYNPVRYPERARERRNVVLSQMVKRGYLEEERYQEVKDRPLGVDFERQTQDENLALHFTEHVRGWLIDWADRHGYNIYRDSLTVHTTLDSRLQEMAQQAVDRWMPALQAVAGAEWSQPTVRVISESPEGYRQYQGGGGFDHLWESRPELVNAFIRGTPQYRAGVEAGISEEEMLDSLRADDTFMDALREVKTRLEAGFAALDPETGFVKAWVGSRDFEEDQYDHVANARRQPGSTFKPFVYAAALEEGYEPDDTFPDREIEIHLQNGEIWRPVNAGGFSGNDVTLADGLAYSKNTITAQLIEEVGPRDVARLARQMGVRRSRLQDVPSLALGTSEVSLLEMVSAYGTMASGGVYRQPLLVTHIEDKDGNVVAEFASKPRRVLSEETAAAVVDMMRGVVDRGTGTGVRTTFGIQADVAGKTGTTQDNADGWFILMHPKLVAGAWVGFNDPRVAFRSDYWGQGGHNALYIVGDFFNRALRSPATDLVRFRFPELPEDELSGSFLARAGDWIAEAGRWVGGAVGSVMEGIASLFSGEAEENMAAPPAERDEGFSQVPPDVDVESEDEMIELPAADSLTRAERESTQLDRVLERLREERGENIEVEMQDASEEENSPEGAEDPPGGRGNSGNNNPGEGRADPPGQQGNAGNNSGEGGTDPSGRNGDNGPQSGGVEGNSSGDDSDNEDEDNED
jgi:penicillin-binding protein 1A